MARLEIVNVTKKYPKAASPALQDVSLSVTEGEILGLSGHNGAGKSTLMGVINGSLKYDGSVLIDNKSATPAVARKHIATMAQSHAPLKGVTPKSAIITAAGLRGIPAKTAKQIADTLMERFSITEYANVRSEDLSGGLRRLVSFCMCEAQNARISLLDEPTNDVDPMRRKLFWEYIKEKSATGRTYLVSTHNIQEMTAYSNHQVILNHGRIIYDGNALNKTAVTGHIYIDFNGPVPEKVRQIFAGTHDTKIEYSGNGLIVPSGDAGEINNMLLNLLAENQDFSFTVSTSPSFEALYDRLTAERAGNDV